MFKMNVKSPTRVDLAGGTLDCWPLYLFLPEPVTVNVAIDIFTHVELTELASREVHLTSDDLHVTRQYHSLDECLADTDPAFELVRAHLAFWRPERGFALTTRSESPVGGGLGGSSSLCISLLKAFTQWLLKPMSPDEMVRIASHLEAQVLLKPTGTQDYFPAIHGGLCVIHYGVRGPQVEVRNIDADIFRDRFLLVYTGRSHHSGINNWQVIKQWLDGDQVVRGALHALAEVSQRMREAIVTGNVASMLEIFRDELRLRITLANSFTSPEIEHLASIASEHHAVAKICGAGGGGCVLVWCPDRQIAQVRSAVERAGFQVLNARPWSSNVKLAEISTTVSISTPSPSSLAKARLF